MEKVSFAFKLSVIATLFFAFLFCQNVFAQTSVASGPWSNPATWGGMIPGASANAIIAVGHTVTIDNVTDLNTNNNVTVQGTLTINSGSINPFQDVTVAIAGTINVEAGGFLLFAGTATINGTYNHNRNGSDLPIASWGANSNCNVTGITTTPLGGAGFGQTFGNFTWNCTGQTATQNTGAGGDMTLTGSFTVNSTNSNLLRFARNLNVAGNYTDNIGTAFLDFYTNGVTTTLNGTGTQTLTMGTSATRFHNLVINKATGIVDVGGASNTVIVSNALTLTNGRVRLNANELSFGGAAANITRTNGWVEATNTGVYGGFSYNAGAAAINVLFPIGDATNYQPIRIANVTASGAWARFITPNIPVPSGGVGSWLVRTFAGSSAVTILNPQGGTLDATSRIYINPNFAGTWTAVTTNYAAPNYTSTAAVTTGNVDEFSVYSLPVPTIVSVSPGSGIVGTSVTITGTNFNPSAPNDVYFGGVKVTANANAGGTSIAVNVPVGASSVTPIVVRNNANGLQGSSLTAATTKQFTVTNTPNLSPLATNYRQSNFTTGTSPRATVVGDFNNDGNPDIAIVNQGSDNVSIRLGDGAGNFANTATIPLPLIGAFPYDITTGDFNGDGNLDLITANFGTNDVSVLLGDGAGGFPTVNNFPIFINYQNPVAVSLADFNNDGYMDFAVACTNGSPLNGGVSVRFGDGTGTNFTGTVDLTSADPNALAIGDFDNDGDIDIAVGEANTTNNLYIWTNDGTGAFTPPAISTVGGGPIESMASGHFNADSNVDLIIGTSTSNSAYLYTGNGAGVFVNTATIALTTTPRAVVIGDFNGDGSSDFATAHGAGGNNIQITLGNGAGVFGTPRVIPFTGAFGISQGDFNNDGRADLAAVNISGGGTALIYDPSIAFVTTWITTTNDITIPTTGGGYNYNVTWTNLTNAGVGDGSATGQTGNYTITGLENGSTYRVEISGTFPHFYMNNDATERTKIRTIEQWGSIAWTSMENAFLGCTNLTYNATDAPNLAGSTSMRNMFGGCSSFNGNASMNTWNTASVTDMSYLFNGASIFNQNISGWNTSAVTDMSFIFDSATAFNQPLNTWTVSSVTNMYAMFHLAFNFNQPLNTWNTGNVTSMGEMFNGAIAFNQPIGGWNVSAVTNMAKMFEDADAFNQNIAAWNVSAVTNMSEMFRYTAAFNQDLSAWNVSNVADMNLMFNLATAFNQSLGSWTLRTAGVSMANMLDNCGMSTANYEATLIGWSGPANPTGVTLGAAGRTYCSAASVTARGNLTGVRTWTITGDALNCPFITTWITTDGEITIPTTGGGYNYDITWTNLTNAGVGDGSITGQTGNYTITGLENGSTYRVEISGTFPRIYFNGGTQSLKIRTIEQWGDIAWTSMNSAFWGCSNLTYNATDNPDLSGVTDMQLMFIDCSAFNGNINTWDVSNVTNMSNMFRGATVFNQPLNTWDVSNVTNMSGMFYQATAFNQDISGWVVSSVTDMSSMFFLAPNFNQPIGSWNTAAVTTMSNMFRGATAFNQDISGWTTNAVTDMSWMFDTATAFNQDISTWNTAAVITMRAMFIDATSFNQNINTWNTGNVINMEGMFSGATSFNQPLNTWNTANVTNMGFMFVNATAFNQSLAAWNMGAVTNAGGMLNNSGLSIANYDATLIGWAGQTLQTGVALGAVGLQYCAGAAARTTLTGAPNNWVITGDALSCAALPFITTWITGDGEITIPTTGGGYNYNVTWTNLTNAGVGDGSITGQTGNYTITGLENGSTYRVEISGNFPHFYMNNDATNAPKLRTIEQWGDIAWTSMANAFHGSANLTYNATDVPNLAGVTDMSFMFTNCSSFNGNASMNTWNTTSITNMSYLFAGASVFNQDISGWDVSNVTNMSGMFILASAFNQDISGWTTNNVISMYAMFQDAIAFNQNIGGWTTTAVTNMSYLFAGATVFNQDISGWNTAAVTDMSYMFNAATAFNQNIGGWTTAAVTTMSNIFNSATTFNQNLATWNISTVTDMTDMLSNSGLSLANYDATLIGWAGQTVQAGVNLGATGLQYCAGAAARTTLTGVPNNWTITGDTQVCAGYFSRKTGNWSDVTAGDGTWSTIAVGGASCDCTPVAGADVVIDAAHIVTADVNTNTNSIALGGTLDLQDLTHTFTDITNNGGAGILRIGGGTAAGTIAGTTGTFFTTATNTVVFDGTVLYALPNRNYPTLEITGTGVRTLGGGTVDILGNLNATGGTASFASTATINFPNVGILPHLIQGTAGDQISLTDVTVNGDTEVNAGFGFNFNGVVTVNAGFTFTNNNAFLQANSPTSDIAGAGTFVNRSVVYWLSDVTPSIANFDANTNANTFVYQTGTAPPRNAIYDVLFFRDTRSTVAGAITANQITFDNFASPAALNLDNTNITVNNNLELANPNGGTLNFGTGNATVIVNGNLIAATAGSTITHNAGVGNTQVLDLVGATNALDAFTNTSVGTSIVRYSGVNQQVFASPNYQNLEILGGGVKNLLGAVTASGTLTLTNGRLQLGANDLTLSNAIVANQLTGAPYTTSWVETDGAGSLIRQGAGAGIDFPVGDATAVRLVNFSNTDAGNNIVRFNPTIAPIITGANPAAGMWTVNTNVTTDLTFSNVGGTADATSEIHYDNAGWTALTTTGGTPPYIATGFVFTGVEVNFTIFSPSVVIDVSMADLTAVNINEDIFKANRQRIYAMEISATGGAPTLTDLVTTTTLGTYTAADIANFELYYNTVDNFTTATLIATSGASTGSGENISFTGFSQIIAGGGVPQYLYIAANVNAGATTGNTMSIPFLAVGNFTFIETVNPTASLGPSGTKTISDATLPFITTWITTDGTIIIPTNGGGYNYDVTWTNLTNAGVGDGFITGQTGNYTITGLENGSTYRVEISKDFPHFFMNNNATEAPKLRTIEQWGNIAWASMANAFHGSANLTYNATDVPNLAGVTDMSFMFTNCSSFNGNASMNTWNTTSITNMSYLFAGASVFNQDISGWDVSNVTNMSGMFILASAFNQDIGGWTTNNVISMLAMFQDAIAFNQNIGVWTTTAVTNMSYLFAGATVFNQDISGWNTAAVTTMSNIFNSATTFNQNLATWNISNVTDMTDMLSNSGLSLANYDATLIGWATQTVQAGVNLGATGLQYCAGAAARTTLTNTPNNWVITGDAQLCAGYFSRKTGNWSDVTAGDGTWSTVAVGGASCDCTPVAGADVVIDAAHIVTADVSTNTNSIALGGTLDLQDLTHTSTDINNNGGAGVLRIGGGTAAGTIAGTTGTFFTTATNTVEFYSTNIYDIPNRNYPSLAVSDASTKTLAVGGAVNIGGNLTVNTGAVLNAITNNVPITFPAGTHAILTDGAANLADVNVNGNTVLNNSGAYLNIAGNMAVALGVSFTNQSTNFGVNFNTLTSLLSGAGTYVNDTDAQMVYRSNVTPTIANFDATALNNGVLYDLGTAAPFNTTYYNLFFRDTRNTTAGTMTAYNFILDQVNPRLNLVDGTNIIVTNNLSLINTNPILDFGTGNATVTVAGNLVATAGTIIHSPAATFTQTLILNGVINDLGTFTVNPTAGTSVVRYAGVNQQVFASANYENIEIAGGGVKTLAGAVGASGTLTLTNGRLQLGANDLTLSNAIVANQLTGAPYTTSWVETDGAGSLIRQGADANVDFPVGDATAVRLATLSATAVGNNSARFTTVVAPPITGTNGSAGMWVMNRPAGASDITFSNVGGTSDATSEIHEGGWTLLPTTGGRPPYIAAGVAFTGANQNFTIFTAAAATYYSVGTGNWNNPASWSTVCGGAGGAGVPTAIDNVIICAGTNITLASPSACANLTVEATGALELANQDFTVNGITTIDGNLRDTQNGGTNTFTGNVTVNAGGALEALGTNSPFNFGANITNSGTFDLQNVTNNLNGINAIITANTNMKFNPDFVGTTNFNANCTLAGAGIITFSAATNTVAAGVTVTNNANADFFYVNPTAGSPTSTFINGANAFLTLRGIALPMTGGIFTANAVNNTVSYSRNAIQNILGGITYHHLEVYTNTKTIIGGNTIVNGNLTIRNTPNTILDANNFNINIRGNWITQAGSSFVGGTGTVTFDGNVAQSISGATNFNNLTVNQIPANLLTVNNPITVTGTLSLTNGRLQLGPNNLILNNPIVATQLVGAPYTTSWIETNAAGSLIRQGAVTGMDFPVGDATGVRLVSMSISGAGDNTVRFSPAIAPPIAGTNPAAGMWIINRTAGTTDLIFSNVGGTADATSQIHSGGWTVLATNVTLPNYTTTAGVAFTGVAQNFTIFTPSPVTPPTIQSFDIRFLSVTANTVGLQWTNGDGANRIVVASTSNVFTPPTNGVAYTIGQTLGAGTVVYNGNGNIATAYGLIPETKYFFHVFEYNGTGTTTAYNIFPATNNPNSITTLAIPPQNQPTNLIISDITAKSAKATFTLPIPVPAGHVAVIRKPDIDPLAPADGQTPTVGTLFFNGQTVVFSGNGNSFDLSNLEPFTTYIVEVYAYNGSGASITYKKDNPLSAEFTTSALLPTLTSLSVNEKEVGENAFTLQAIGSNFTSKTILRWQGKDLKTNFINKNNLSADVPRELLAEAGIFNIIAFTPPMGGGESNSLQFQVIAVTNISSVPVVSRTVPPDKNDHLLDRIAFEVVGGDVFLKEIRFTTNGSYQITDLKNMAFALKYSTDESLDNSDVTWATTTAVNSNGSIIFDFSQTLPTPQLPKNKTSFLFLTVNISKDAKAGNEIGTAPTNFDNIQFFGKVVKRGDNPTSAGTTQKIISVTPSPQDYSALLKFFNELGGTDWEESWNLDNPVNTWKGVELDEEGRVFAINLPNNNVVGELSDALTNEGVLVSTNLRYLNLSGNRIKGQIPPNLGNLTDLEYLDLSKNELSGSVPPSIGNLTKLVTLWLGYNNLTTIDIDFGRLTNLRNLFLQFNGFDKLPDNIGELKNLEVLSLKGNKFKTLPSTLGGLSKLKYLDISENELEQVPTGITNLTELEGLLMHINFFKTIPSDLLNLKKLNLFTTYENLLEFGSLEPLRTWWSNQSKMDITYFPQARIGRSQEVTVEVGSSFTFNLPVTGTANRYQWFKNGISISLSSNSSLTIPSVSVQDAGIYTLRVTNNLVPNLVLQSYEMLLSVDCGNARQTIKPKITIEGSSVFCNNEPVNTRLTTEIRPEISRYQWFLDGVLIANANSNSITVLDAGRYKVQIFTNDGCSLFSDAEVTITKLSAFTVNITQNQGVLVAGVANRVISNYEWFLNGNLIPNANQARYLPTERGNYTVRVTDVDGCRSTSAVEIVSSVTSTEESIYEGEIKVYPNPSDAIFYLEVGKEKALKIQLFNTLGQFFNQKIRHLQGNRYEINLGNQAWGMYFIEVTYQDGKVIKKLVKE